MIGGSDLSARFALDVQGVGDLKAQAHANSPEALKTVARQFEAVFMNMLLKSMRDATPKEGMFESEQTRMFTGMLDQQLAQSMANKGLGLADLMVRQLSGALPGNPYAAAAFEPLTATTVTAPIPRSAPVSAALSSAALSAYTAAFNTSAFGIDARARTPVGTPLAAENIAGAARGDAPAHVAAFVEKLLPHAQAAAQASGIPAHYLLGQAALETGWGRSELRGGDGGNSHNLFGIKAGAGWRGPTVDVVTTEYVAGVAHKQVERFRAYASYAESFADYARLLTQSTRYQAALAATDAGGFATGLQRGGYATDPNYAAKLERTIRLAAAAT